MNKTVRRRVLLISAIVVFYLAAQAAGSFAIRQMFMQQVINDLKPQAKVIAAQYAAGNARVSRQEPYIVKILDVFGNQAVLADGDEEEPTDKEAEFDRIILSALKKELPSVIGGKEISGFEDIPGLEEQSLIIGEPALSGTTVVGAVFLMKPTSDYRAVLNGFTIVFSVTMLAGVLLFSILLKMYLDDSKRLERVRREYVANVSHELKSPISSIKALTETLSDGLASDDGTRQRYYGIILNESNRLQKLISEILELSRLQSGRAVITKQKTDAGKMMQTVRDEYTVRADDLGIEFTVTETALGLPSLFTNEDRIQQILHILLDNAFKFMGENGKVTLDARIFRTHVLISVCDNGAGIAKDVLPYVFDRFYKEDKARNSSGSGLGLSIARELLRGMGEKIEVKSEPGKGSEFSFTVKRA